MSKNELLDELEKSDRDFARKLNEILSIIARHKAVYDKAKDPAISQIWLAIVEIYSRQEKIQRQISQMSRPELAISSDTASSRISKLIKKKKESADILETLENY